MILSSSDFNFFNNRAECFSNSKLHALDKYWSNNNSHPMHSQIHKIIENILHKRGEKTLKQTRLELVMNFERSLSISTPLGRLSANIIALFSRFAIPKI